MEQPPTADAALATAGADEGDTALLVDQAQVKSTDQVSGFAVKLDGFEGPFDLLLHLIAKHKLEVTELALAQVTDDFCSYIRSQGNEWPLEETTQFLVVASTLLDLKAARLLPSGEVEDEEDLALLEARDLLFMRLLQYRAFKEMSAHMGERLIKEARRVPRTVALEPRYASLLPEVLLGISPERLAELAAKAMAPKAAPPTVSISHVHAPPVSVKEQAGVIAERLRKSGSASFRALVADAESTLVVVARFLALLELYRENVVAFDQAAALGELHVRWTGGSDQEVEVADEFDLDQLDEADQAHEQTHDQNHE